MDERNDYLIVGIVMLTLGIVWAVTVGLLLGGTFVITGFVFVVHALSKGKTSGT